MYYGIATFKGFYVFNRVGKDHKDEGEPVFETGEKKDNTVDLSKFKTSLIAFLHAFVSLLRVLGVEGRDIPGDQLVLKFFICYYWANSILAQVI